MNPVKKKKKEKRENQYLNICFKKSFQYVIVVKYCLQFQEQDFSLCVVWIYPAVFYFLDCSKHHATEKFCSITWYGNIVKKLK